MIELDKYGNCESSFTGSGQTGCDILQFGDLNGVVLFKKGYSKTIDTDSFDLAAFKNDVKSLKAFPYFGLEEFTQDTPENEIKTYSTGKESVVRDGRPKFTLMYEKGACNQKSLRNKKNGAWDVALVFDKGILMATNVNKTRLKAFSLGMFSVETMKFQQGSDLQTETIKLQLEDSNEFNERFTFIPFVEVGDLREVGGVVESKITVDPITAGGDITFSVTSSCNADNSILDLDEANKFVLLGTQASATTLGVPTYNASTNKYVVTPTPALSAADTVAIKLGDGTYDVIEDTLGTMFKGASNIVTVS